MEGIIEKISFFFGAFIVLLFCIRYFNEPKYPLVKMDQENDDDPDVVLEPAFPKFMTKRYQYNLYLTIFVLVTETLYLLLSFYLPDFLGDTGKKVREFGYNALASALIITGVLPNLQFIKGFLEKTKIFLHSKAQIPSKGQDIYQILKNRKIQYSEGKIKQIINDPSWSQITLNNGNRSKKFLCENDFDNENRMNMRGKWAELTYLFFQIEKWSGQRPFKNCVGNSELRWNSIKTSYDTLKNKIYSYHTNNLTELQKSELNTKVDTLMLRTYRLISCLLFIADKNSCDLNDYMKELGYNPQEPPIFAIPFTQIAFAAISTGAGIFIGASLTFLISITLDNTFLSARNIGVITTSNLLLWIAYGIPFLTIPVLFVLFVKRHLSFKEDRWPLATPRNEIYRRLVDRPWLIYLAVAGGAYIVSFFTLVILNACFNLLGVRPSQSEINQIQIFLIWSLVGMITAAFVAYRIDSARDITVNKLYKTLLTVNGSLFQALMTSATIYFAFMHVANDGFLDFELLENQEKARLCVYLIMGFFIGALLFITSQFNTKQYERRKHGRKPVNNEINLEDGDRSMKGVLLNLSKSGGLVKSGSLNKDVGDRIKLAIEDNVIIEAEIVKFDNENIRLQFKEDVTRQHGRSNEQKTLQIFSIWNKFSDGNLLAKFSPHRN